VILSNVERLGLFITKMIAGSRKASLSPEVTKTATALIVAS
jgi:hypothetical protein